MWKLQDVDISVGLWQDALVDIGSTELAALGPGAAKELDGARDELRPARSAPKLCLEAPSPLKAGVRNALCPGGCGAL